MLRNASAALGLDQPPPVPSSTPPPPPVPPEETADTARSKKRGEGKEETEAAVYW